jgi:ATP-dependent Clp protease ATP-binding subunit ClpC
MEQLTKAARMVLEIGAAEAARSRHAMIEREHLLIGLCSLGKVIEYLKFTRMASLPVDAIREESDRITAAFASQGSSPETFRRRLRSRLRPGNVLHSDPSVTRSRECLAIFRRAEGMVPEGKEVSAPLLFVATIESGGPFIGGALASTGLDGAKLCRDLMDGVKTAPGREIYMGETDRYSEPSGEVETSSGATPLLDRYCRDLTKEAQEARLMPFVESDRMLSVLRQLLKVLMMTTKNNPILIGEAGVGKTAVVEALAERIAMHRDRDVIAGRRLVELSMADLVSGTKFRGEFEERLTRLIDEVRGHPEVILFIDEFHTVAGAGRADGAPMDAGNIMKPALARGDPRCIGSTTITEFRRSIEKDAALERRFQAVMVPEPGRVETLQILNGIRPHRERHFGVTIADKTLNAAVDLAIRFDPSHFLPDKAIDLLDRACAECRVPILSLAGDGTDYPAVEVAEVTPEYVTRVVSEKFTLPLEVVSSGLEGISESRFRGLSDYLSQHIVGQEGAISRVCSRLLLAHAGLGDQRRPLGVFLFLGPSGVGKTRLAQCMAQYLFANENAFIRLDMSEYQDESSVSRLVGAAPGYIGHEEGGQLVERLRTTPYSVVLLDEVEKASPRVFDMFLQLYDDGRITDSQGRTAVARNAIFVMTGNIRVERKGKMMGFKPHGTEVDETRVSAEEALSEVRRRFRPEFLNRIDEQIVFRALTRKDVRKVLAIQLEELRGTLARDHGVRLEVDEDAAEFLAVEGYHPDYGVRELSRVIDRRIRIPIGEMSAGGILAAKAESTGVLKIRRTPEGVSVE